MLEVGDSAPDFSLPDSEGNLHSLSEFRGRKAGLYFYPKDDTPGCTVEACGFRDVAEAIAGKGAVVVGVSADSPESHAKFSKKFSLNFLLLCDPEKNAIKAYGAWGRKKSTGREYDGVLRTTFIIGTTGKIERIFKSVKPEGHAKEVLGSI